MMNTLNYQETSTLMKIFQHSINNWKRSPWLCISTISWWEWNWTKPSGTDVREYECYSQDDIIIIMCKHVSMWVCYSHDDVNYYVHACLYVVICVKVWRWSCVYICGRMWRCDHDRILVYWLTTHFDKVNQADRASLNCWKSSRKEYTRGSCDR